MVTIVRYTREKYRVEMFSGCLMFVHVTLSVGVWKKTTFNSTHEIKRLTTNQNANSYFMLPYKSLLLKVIFVFIFVVLEKSLDSDIFLSFFQQL